MEEYICLSQDVGYAAIFVNVKTKLTVKVVLFGVASVKLKVAAKKRH